jgi:predicted deacylase
MTAVRALGAPSNKTSFKIGEIVAAPGEKSKGFVPVAETSTGTQIRVPVTIINGSSDGPTVLICSGIHGDDLTSIPVVWRVSQEIDPGKLRGQIVCMPFANPPAIEARSHLTPEDRKSPTFPGRPDGTISERIGHGLLNHIVSKVNYAVDLHGGSMEASLAMLVVVDPVGGEVQKTLEQMAKAFNANLTFFSGVTAGKNTSDSLHGFANRNGIPSINIGMGKIGFHEKSTMRGTDSVLNVLKYLNMIEGSLKISVEPFVATKEIFKFSSHNGGFFPLVEENARVTEGQKVGYIVDSFGDLLADVTSPATGMVLAICYYPLIKAGDFLVSVASA